MLVDFTNTGLSNIIWLFIHMQTNYLAAKNRAVGKLLVG